jgi:hypothetical protein
MSLFALSEIFERTRERCRNLVAANVALRHRCRRAEHELEELRMTVHQHFALHNDTAWHTLKAESATYAQTLRVRGFGCTHPNFTDDGVCTLCKEHYDRTHDRVTESAQAMQQRRPST